MIICTMAPVTERPDLDAEAAGHPTERLEFSIEINAPIQTVWEEITRTDGPQPAIFNMCLHTPGLEVGAPMRMRTRNGKYTGMVGDVVEFDPPRVFAHTLKFTQYDDPPCTVRYVLEPIGEKATRFTLTVLDCPAGTKTSKNMARGGTFICNTLKTVCERGRPSFGTRMIFKAFRLMEPFSPSRTRSSNWP